LVAPRCGHVAGQNGMAALRRCCRSLRCPSDNGGQGQEGGVLRRSAQNARVESPSRKQLAAAASFPPSRWRRPVRCFPMNSSSVTFAITRACTIRERRNTRTLIAKRLFGEKSQTLSACRPSNANTGGATCGIDTPVNASGSRSSRRGRPSAKPVIGP